VIFNDDMVDGRERVTTDEERVLRGGLNRDKFVKIARLTGCKNFTYRTAFMTIGLGHGT